MILITTCRRPTRRIRTLCNDLQRVIPNSIRINRGKLNREGISEKALETNADRIIMVARWQGGPGNIDLHTLPLTSSPLFTLYLAIVTTQDELGKRKMVRKDLAITLEKNASCQVKHLAEVFSKFLRLSIVDAEKDSSLKASMHFSNFRGKVKIAFTMPPIINEIGPILIARYTSFPEGDHP